MTEAISATPAASELKTLVTVRPPFSRATTATLRLPFWVLGQATVAAVFLIVRRLYIPSEIRAVDRDRTRYRFALFASERFADFVAENERGLVLNIKVAAQLQCGM